ncbi:hypothetical protein Agub_g11026 [Astrephomene gubernaculifera]|uniref:Peptidase M48 domain-containing protein n=1 Tax=Astrephomene gubernaculifera TaxID=47775 RepID=A0AAD3DVS4_9CHLO|nr:hypothetical protein Agub_g11026 [Astrephomene gubernaculifera]
MPPPPPPGGMASLAASAVQFLTGALKYGTSASNVSSASSSGLLTVVPLTRSLTAVAAVADGSTAMATVKLMTRGGVTARGINAGGGGGSDAWSNAPARLWRRLFFSSAAGSARSNKAGAGAAASQLLLPGAWRRAVGGGVCGGGGAVISAGGWSRVGRGWTPGVTGWSAAAAAAAAAAGGGGARSVGASGSFACAVRTVWQDSRGYQHFKGRGGGWSFTGPRTAYTLTAVAAGGVLYYVYCLEQVPYTGRWHSIMLVSAANERWMGRTTFEEQKAIARAEGRLLPDAHPDVQRVRRLGLAIAAAAVDGGGGGRYDHMRDAQWEFAVVDSAMPNAFVVPGGKVVVFSGLLRLLGGSDDELAAVLAHEVAHVLARHTAERLSTLNVWTLLNMTLRLTLGFGLPNVAMYMGIFLPYSRLAEHEADVIGLRLMARACFDPAAAPAMLAKLNSKEKQMQKQSHVASVPYFLRTHPLTDDRVSLVEQQLPEAIRMFRDAGCAAKRSAFNRGWSAWGGGGGEEGGYGDGTVAEVIRFG